MSHQRERNAIHTPGPWSLGSDPRDIESYRYGHVAMVTRVSGKIDEKQSAANAHLIAAAPYMLEALKAILASSDPNGYGAPTDAQIPDLRDALRQGRLAVMLATSAVFAPRRAKGAT